MTPREIDQVLGRLSEIQRHQERQDTQFRDHKEQLNRIEQHAATTNGRVTALEKWRAWTEGVRAGLSWLPTLGTGIVSGVIVAVVAFLLTAGV